MRSVLLVPTVFLIVGAIATATTPGATVVPVTSGLHCRYAADSLTGLNDGDRVTTWQDDLSGHGRDVTQATVTRQPVYMTDTLNGLPVVRFTGSEYLGKPGDSFQAATLFVIGKAASSHTGALLSEHSTDESDGENNRSWFLMARPTAVGDPPKTNYSRWYTTRSSVPASTIDGPNQGALDWSVLAASFSNAAGGYNEFFVNGESQGSNNVNPAWDRNTNLYIGAYQVAGDPPAGLFFKGDIAEIIAYDRVLSTAERRLVENALSAKYDLGIGHLYRGDSEQYDFNVVGIGREAGSLVASSPGKGLSTGLILSQHTELQDGQYLLAGDRNTANSWVTDGLPSGVLRRWSRDWFLSPTGGLADALLTFDFDDAGLAYSAGMEYDVLYRADATGAFERLNLTGTFDNNQLAFVVGDSLLGEGTYTLGMVPEPGSLLLLAMALGAVLLMRV